MATKLAKNWRMLAALLAAGLVLVAIAVAPTAEGFEGDVGDPAWTLTYDIEWSEPIQSLFDDRVEDAADEWSDNAPGVISYNSNSTNMVGLDWMDPGYIALSSVTSCEGDDGCTIDYNKLLYLCDGFYHGTGNSGGVAQGLASCGGGQDRYDVWGIAVHEFGHWRGLHHDALIEDDDDLDCEDGDSLDRFYAPDPENEMMSMCYTRYEPAVEGGTGEAGVAPQRTLSQDEIQGVHDYQTGRLNANNSFDDCATDCEWDDRPLYWWFTPNSNHFWSSGFVSLNDNPTVPYPEVVQRVQGEDADGDDNGIFYAAARVKAIVEDARAVVFVRHWHDTYANHEKSCTDWNLEVGVWTTIECEWLYLDPGNVAHEFEYGVRVTDKIDISWVIVTDIHGNPP